MKGVALNFVWLVNQGGVAQKIWAKDNMPLPYAIYMQKFLTNVFCIGLSSISKFSYTSINNNDLGGRFVTGNKKIFYSFFVIKNRFKTLYIFDTNER